MGFGGSVSAMLASLKSNKRTRVSTFDKIKNHKEGKEIKLHFKNKATAKQLADIREKLQKENRQKLVKYTILLIVFISVLIYFIGFVKI